MTRTATSVFVWLVRGAVDADGAHEQALHLDEPAGEAGRAVIVLAQAQQRVHVLPVVGHAAKKEGAASGAPTRPCLRAHY